MKSKIHIGFDFDGVIAYNPARIIRAPVSLFKRKVLHDSRLHFIYPKHAWQRFIWKLLHESSLYPAKGIPELRDLLDRYPIEAHLITGRYRFLDDHLHNWLSRYQLHDLFTSININSANEQPHLFKEHFIKKCGIQYFVEDNLDIVMYLQQHTNAKVYWIYNLLDRWYSYDYKHPDLRSAVRAISTSIQQQT